MAQAKSAMNLATLANMQMALGGSGHRILQARSTVEMGFQRVCTMIKVIIMLFPPRGHVANK
jgi:hypothetical protein